MTVQDSDWEVTEDFENLSLNSPLSNNTTNSAVINTENRPSAQSECLTDTVFNYGDRSGL